MKKTLMAVVVGLALSACGGNSSVVTVDGATFDVDDIPARTTSSVIDLDTFRNALNWVIRDQVLTSAARREFGISLSEDELVERATLALELLSPADAEDPRGNLDYFLIQARVGLDGMLWPKLEPLLPDDVSSNQWAIEKLSAAAVEVNARYGEWRVTPEPLVYQP